MRRIAHVSDVHMLDPNTRRSSARYRFAVKAVSLGRSIDPRDRAQKLSRALAAAKASRADHVVISGDLTEVGEAAEFEHFAEVLDASGLPDHAVTLVPGNHDAYTSPGSWAKALAGPLRRWAPTSAAEPGKLVERGDVLFMPIDTTLFQSIARAGGEFTREAARAVERRVADPATRDKAIVLVLHHPPFMHYKNPLMQWMDGLRGWTHAFDLLMRDPRVQILHGHLHKVVDRIVELGKNVVGGAARARVFGAPAIVDDEKTPRVRLYDVRGGALESVGLYAM